MHHLFIEFVSIIFIITAIEGLRNVFNRILTHPRTVVSKSGEKTLIQ